MQCAYNTTPLARIKMFPNRFWLDSRGLSNAQLRDYRPPCIAAECISIQNSWFPEIFGRYQNELSCLNKAFCRFWTALQTLHAVRQLLGGRKGQLLNASLLYTFNSHCPEIGDYALLNPYLWRANHRSHPRRCTASSNREKWLWICRNLASLSPLLTRKNLRWIWRHPSKLG